jgi:hypothetical protein
MRRYATDPAIIRKRIDRYGSHEVTPIHRRIPCMNCQSPKFYQEDGLCVDCRRVLGLLNAPRREPDEQETQ